MGRPLSEKPMVHTAVLLPRSLLERLKGDAEASKGGLSTEIRQRLQMSFDREGLDPQTSDLVERIKDLADSLARDLGWPWHRHAFGQRAMEAGVIKLLGEYRAEGDTLPDTPFSGYPDDASPEVVGQTHARLIMAARRSGEKRNDSDGGGTRGL